MMYEVGQVVEGTVTGIQPYGAFVKLDGDINGLIHISEISDGFVKNIEHFVKVGDVVQVKIIGFDEDKKHAKLSLKALRKNRFYNHTKSPFVRRSLPEMNLGFSSIENHFEQWVEEASQNDKPMMTFDFQHGLLQEDIFSYQEEVSRIHTMIHEKSGPGNDFLGWVDWAYQMDMEEVHRIQELAMEWKNQFDVLVVCGIGGSYLGARAAIEMIQGLFPKDGPEVIYFGNTFSSEYSYQVLEHLKGKNVLVNVISKSGTTTETAVAFRLLKQFMEDTYGKEEASNRIFATTDHNRGALKTLANYEGYETFVIPDDIGGRYSVLTSVGLLPMALAGIDIEQVILGYRQATTDLNHDSLQENQAYQYAVARRILQNQGYQAELFVSYEPQFAMLAEWWKQLLGESEGKQGKGILPDSVTFSTDLHSLGQFIQEGNKMLFETNFLVEEMKHDVMVPSDIDNFDQMNYLSGRTLNWVNEMAFEGTLEAHEKTGNVPNLIIRAKDHSAYAFGYLAYWFFIATAMTCYMLDINPFNQPGVEVYKKNMFSLLGKPE